MKLLFELLLSIMIGGQIGPVFAVGMWPGEGIPHFVAKGPELVVYEAPSTAGREVGRYQLSEGTELEYSETRYQTASAGLLVARSEATVQGRNFTTRRALSRDEYYRSRVEYSATVVQVGDTVAYLQYRAEGTCFVLIGEDLWDANSCPASRQGVFSSLAEPEVEWWIRTLPGTLPAGWLLVDEAKLRIRRSF